MGEAVTKRLLATIAFIALFHILGLIPMPTVDKDYLQSVAGAERRVRVTALGIGPWVTGFLFVELCSFASRRGRQLRRAGTAGRRRLNALSVRAGVVLAVIQAAGVAIALARQSLLVSDSDSLLFGLVVTDLTFVAGSVLVFLLAQAVSRWGLGNGVCLFLILPIVEALIGFYRASALSVPPVLSGIEFLLGLAGVGLLVKMFMRGPVVVLSDSEKREVPSTFSAFPQDLCL
jgi:preprotein translocase subunit SecY